MVTAIEAEALARALLADGLTQAQYDAVFTHLIIPFRLLINREVEATDGCFYLPDSEDENDSQIG